MALKQVKMILFKEAAALKKYVESLKNLGKTIGFVPTMGALHDGHISLIKSSNEKCDVTVCSIFVNPTQFNDPKDFEKYPVTISNDILILEENSCDVLFLPAVMEMYPAGTTLNKKYELGPIETLLEGKFRPGHFQGVCQIVDKLLNIVKPSYLFMGEKDYQQCLVIKKLVELENLPVEVIVVKTYREENGLAMSSRNLRLNEVQRKKAVSISAMLNYIKNNYTTIPLLQLQQTVNKRLLEDGFEKVDYVAIADPNTLEPVAEITQASKAVALIAASIGNIRLIDNKVLTD